MQDIQLYQQILGGTDPWQVKGSPSIRKNRLLKWIWLWRTTPSGRVRRVSLGCISLFERLAIDVMREMLVEGASQLLRISWAEAAGIKSVSMDMSRVYSACDCHHHRSSDRSARLYLPLNGRKRIRGCCAVLADGGYNGETFRQEMENLLGARVEIAKHSDLRTFTVIPKRWVVERSLLGKKMPSTLENCEYKLHVSLQFVCEAFLVLLPRRA